MLNTIKFLLFKTRTWGFPKFVKGRFLDDEKVGANSNDLNRRYYLYSIKHIFWRNDNMKKINFIMFILLIILTSSALAEEFCSETDSGRDFDVKGVLTNTYYNYEKVDFCLDTITLYEYECLLGHDTGDYNGVEQVCEFGCQDGRCLKEGEERKPEVLCDDSDGGKDFYTKGKIQVENWGTSFDSCFGPDSINLLEHYCEEGKPQEIEYKCPTVCREGACLKVTCEESDGGDNYYEKGTVSIGPDKLFVDSCKNEKDLIEYSCDKGVGYDSNIITCMYGCEKGACLKMELKPNIESGPVEIPIEEFDNVEIIPEIKEESIVCYGCKTKNQCYPLGFRKNREYCSENNKFENQKSMETNCENNFECESNVCVNDKCISPDFIQRIIDWFKKLFGG
jgi:hypothetical protein